MKTKLDLLREFYGGRIYPLLVLILAVVANSTGTEFWCYLINVLLFFVGALIAYDLRFALTPFLCTVFFVSPLTAPDVTGFRDNYIKPFPIIMMAICFGLIFVSTVIFAIRNRRRVNAFPWKGMFLSLAILCVAICLNGAFSSAYTWQDLLYALTFPAALLVLYVLFALYVKFDESVFPYFMYCMVIACTVICIQLVLRYLSGAVIVDGAIVKENVVLGWAVWTTLGGMIAMLMPASFYFAATDRHGWVFYLLGLFQFLCTVLSQSRGAMLVGGVILLCSMVLLCFFGPNKKINRFFTLGVILIGVVGVALLWDKVMALLQNFINSGFADNDRFKLWRLGLSKFSEHPVFGAGFYDNGIESPWDIQVYPFFYHNTIIQMLASTGAVGMLAYLWHRFCTVRRVVLKPSLFKSYLGLCILSCLLFCMLDVLLFVTYPLLFYTLMLLFMEKSDEVRNESLPIE